MVMRLLRWAMPQPRDSNGFSTSINDLPYDILYIIFVLCWDKRYPCRKLSFPTIASHVCRKWRDHALETPAFWASLNFQSHSTQLEKHRIWLERSGDHPLDILLFDQRSIKGIKEIMGLIVPCSDRWKTLKISQLPDKVIRVVFDRLLNIPMPMLITLEVAADYAIYTGHAQAPSKWRFRPFWFGGAPKLQNMILEGISCDHIDARFTGLKVLDIFDEEFGTQRVPVILAKVHWILSKLPQLQSLRLRSSRSYPRHIECNDMQFLSLQITPPLSHSSLTELSLGTSPRVRNVIISSLALSEVRYFVDRTRSRSDEWEITLGVCCLPVIGKTRPFPNLISFRLGGNSTQFFPEDSGHQDPRNASNLRHLPGVLEDLKMLRSLTLDQVDLESEGRLNCLSKACPELQWLSFVRCTGYTIAELQSIVEKRKKLRETDSLLHLAVYGMTEDWRTPSEKEARLWLTRAWDGDFEFQPGSNRETPGKNYLHGVQNLF